ncbi:response regulator transcription factor [Streptomyces sp. ISL-36]|uniref:response regulator transcription factor n=1 Tax=Streptomyces sp. ISL-36 TaxID=2819182 RepID=UPI0027E5B8DD|nr:response regulator transcription factor [Streptomyces sp. ISL-36]
MGARILVAEDDEKQSRLIRIYLEREGNAVQVVADGRAALEKVRSARPDLIVLDVMLPLVDGLDVCRILRAEGSDLPILLLTARSTEEDMLLGLDLGADDYLTKPYSPRELTARVRALLRRSRKSGAAETVLLRVGEVELDTARFEVRVAGRPVALTSKEFSILEALAREPGRVFTRARIIERVFGFDRDVLERTVDAHVRNLRLKLEEDPARPRYLETVYGRGYRLADGTGPGGDLGPGGGAGPGGDLGPGGGAGRGGAADGRVPGEGA